MSASPEGSANRFLGRRLASLVVVLLCLSAMTFLLGRLAPGNPAELLLESRLQRQPTTQELAEQERSMGLDQSLAVQYRRWLAEALHGDLGRSWSYGDPVSTLIGQRLRPTATLALVSLGCGLALAVPAGVLLALRRDSVTDHAGRALSATLSSFPAFVLAYLLIYIFGVRLRWLPTFGTGSLRNLVLPVATLTLLGAADLTRLVRSTMLETLGEQYVRTAQAKGARPRRVLFGHGLRNAMVPVLSILGLRLAYLLTGAFLVEHVFSLPGLGRLALDAVNNRDYPLMQGFVLVTGTVFVLTNLAVDLTLSRLDPRVRLYGH